MEYAAHPLRRSAVLCLRLLEQIGHVEDEQVRRFVGLHGLLADRDRLIGNTTERADGSEQVAATGRSEEISQTLSAGSNLVLDFGSPVEADKPRLIDVRTIDAVQCTGCAQMLWLRPSKQDLAGAQEVIVQSPVATVSKDTRASRSSNSAYRWLGSMLAGGVNGPVVARLPARSQVMEAPPSQGLWLVQMMCSPALSMTTTLPL